MLACVYLPYKNHPVLVNEDRHHHFRYGIIPQNRVAEFSSMLTSVGVSQIAAGLR